jgi:valyl-tRNA synthetase
LKKGYDPADVESRHYQRWEDAGYFTARGEGAPYCIVIPPPNVTGTLHMGHAFQVTIMDALTRFHRMKGRRTLWQPGTDHAGIATQMVVERLLNAEGTDRLALGRKKFVERVWEWKQQSGDTIGYQLRRLGASVDWSRDRFTMDPGLSKAVIEVFVRLFDEGLIYRGTRLVNWDPQLHTAISDLEVLSSEESGKLWRFRYPLSDGSGYLVVATTRPETMLGDTAVAVHPTDPRYADLIGQTVMLPLAEREIPVIADEYVDPEFGTGCVKITPAHDFNDYEIGQRHGLPLINIFDENAALNDNVPARYVGLDRFEARERVVADLDAAGLLDGTDDHTAMIPRGDRSGVVIEPYLTDQWYVRAGPLAKPAIEAVEDGRVRFVPASWEKLYFEWMRNIQDWCISRQLWWGHRIPAWYDGDGNVYVGGDEDEVRKKHRIGSSVPLRQDDDVLDTWFSSALWPFSTMGWPDETRELDEFYPTSVLVTAFDIIFFWVARMIMMGLKFMGDVPFREIYMHGLILDHEGQKMSKAKGNILDPIDLIDGVDIDTLVEKRTGSLMQTHMRQRIEATTRKEFPDGIPAFGLDALRLTFASIATTGRNLSLDIARVEGYHRFCNKLWNATSFVSSQIEDKALSSGSLSDADRWIRSRLRATIDAVDAGFANYRFDLVTQSLYEFTWHEFCDWYVEITKTVLNDDSTSESEKSTARSTLAEVLGALLRLLHPLIPFVTEELWLSLCELTETKSESIMLEALPNADDFVHDEDAESEIEWLKTLTVGVRQIRGEMNIPPSKKLSIELADATALDLARAERQRRQIEKLAGVNSISLAGDGSADGVATALVGDMRVLVSLAGIVDVAAERDRLGKQLDKTENDLAKVVSKLGNERFVANAPAAVVDKERERHQELTQRAERLRSQLEVLAHLR